MSSLYSYHVDTFQIIQSLCISSDTFPLLPVNFNVISSKGSKLEMRLWPKNVSIAKDLFHKVIFIDWLEGFHSISHFFLRSFPKVLDISNLANKTELSRAVPANFLLCKHRNTSHKILSFCLRNLIL